LFFSLSLWASSSMLTSFFTMYLILVLFRPSVTSSSPHHLVLQQSLLQFILAPVCTSFPSLCSSLLPSLIPAAPQSVIIRYPIILRPCPLLVPICVFTLRLYRSSSNRPQASRPECPQQAASITLDSPVSPSARPPLAASKRLPPAACTHCSQPLPSCSTVPSCCPAHPSFFAPTRHGSRGLYALQPAAVITSTVPCYCSLGLYSAALRRPMKQPAHAVFLRPQLPLGRSTSSLPGNPRRFQAAPARGLSAITANRGRPARQFHAAAPLIRPSSLSIASKRPSPPASKPHRRRCPPVRQPRSAIHLTVLRRLKRLPPAACTRLQPAADIPSWTAPCSVTSPHRRPQAAFASRPYT
jgi:hypothetical protein